MATEASWRAGGITVSLTTLLVTVLAPFRPTLHADQWRSEQQERESAVLLRQLRAELMLMRRWRDTEREERRQDG
jgi:hypothetical protein